VYICGSGIEETIIISLFHTNEDIIIGNGIYDGLFYTNSGSLSVKNITIVVSLSMCNIFHHTSNGIFSIENILIKPHPIFLSFSPIFLRPLFYFSSTSTINLKSITIKNFLFEDRPIILFNKFNLDGYIIIENSKFINIERMKGNGSIINIDIDDNVLFSVEMKGCIFS
jgi:hypothetical protein